jgi:hypothetical protein
MWQVHKHFIDKSFAQVKQCKWLVEMESILGCGLFLDSMLWDSQVGIPMFLNYESHNFAHS